MRTLHFFFGIWAMAFTTGSIALFLGAGLAIVSGNATFDSAIPLLLLGLLITAAAVACQAVDRRLSKKVKDADENIRKRWQARFEAQREEMHKLFEERDAHKQVQYRLARSTVAGIGQDGGRTRRVEGIEAKGILGAIIRRRGVSKKAEII